MKLSESLWGGFWLLLGSAVSVFSLVCLQGQDDETEDCLGQLLSLACQSVIVFVCLFLPEGLHSWAKTHEIDIGGTERLPATQAVEEA